VTPADQQAPSELAVPVDMNLSPRWVPVLVEAGLAAEHWWSSGPWTHPTPT
jgi:predicted nuclease of predicted toxin-antitoxin system